MSTEQREKIVEITKKLIGAPYKYGASLDEAPKFFDCSSLTQYIFKKVGVEIPRSSILQAADKNGKEIIPDETYSNLEIGDLLFMRGSRGYYNDELFDGREIYIGHVGIYIGNGEIVHANGNKKKKVIKQKIRPIKKAEKNKIILIKRFQLKN